MPTLIPFTVDDELWGLTCSICQLHLERGSGEDAKSFRVRMEVEHGNILCWPPDPDTETAPTELGQRMIEALERHNGKAWF